MRIPFPIKVFVACLAVVAAGALPTYIYIETSFVGQLTKARVDETARRAMLLAEQLRPLTQENRLDTLRGQSRVLPERITYLGSTGVVLFDSAAAQHELGEHSGRPEVAAALGRDPPGPTLDVSEPGVGAAKRKSETTGTTNVYVAVRVDEVGEVVRLAFPARDLDTLASSLRAAFRNSQALALSVALLLSVLAAFVFMRPLQRLARSAQAIASGDYTASENWRGTDEIGDVGLALNTMAMDLRRRLADMQSSETLLLQAAELVDAPIALIEANNEVMTINGAFRRLVEDRHTDAEEVVARVIGSKKYPRAVERAKSGECSEVLDWTRKKIGRVLVLHILQRPATEPLVLLTTEEEERPTLPHPEEVQACTVGELVERAMDRARLRVPNRNIVVDFLHASVAEVLVVEAEQRVELAIALFVEAAARGDGDMRLCVETNGTHVDVWLDGDPAFAQIRLVRLLLEPLGGAVTMSDTVTLQLPKA